MSRPGDLHRLIRSFLDYELPQIEEFRQAQKQFKADLPAVLENLRGAVEEAEAENADYMAAAAGFLELCRQSISPEVSAADVREMLLQHILTKDIFLRVSPRTSSTARTTSPSGWTPGAYLLHPATCGGRR